LSGVLGKSPDTYVSGRQANFKDGQYHLPLRLFFNISLGMAPFDPLQRPEQRKKE
jgi:hypothetical protein